MKQAHQYIYADARDAFLARSQSGSLTSIIHPLAGPDGQLAMDVTYWPGRSTDHVLVVSSATHGIEGYCGSYVQCALLDSGLHEAVTDQYSLLMIHGVNPHGFAWQRRVNENNVDLNRNFIDHSVGHVRSLAYDEVASILEPASWDENTLQEIAAALQAAAARHPDNPSWLLGAVSGGQYHMPHGQFYGGTEAQWSNHQIRRVAREHLLGKQVVWVDVHTALGDYGTAKCLVEQKPDSPALSGAQTLWGERVSNLLTSSTVGVEVAGSMISGMTRDLQGASEVAMIGTGLEYGTVATEQVIGALIQDQYLHRFGALDSDFGRQTKAMMMAAFYPDDPKWRTAVFDIAAEVISRNALDRLWGN